MQLSKIIDFFSPWSVDFQTAIKDFHGLSQEEFGTLKKTAVVGLAILGGLATFYILGLGAFPSFRWAVSWLKEGGETKEGEDSSWWKKIRNYFQRLEEANENVQQQAVGEILRRAALPRDQRPRGGLLNRILNGGADDVNAALNQRANRLRGAMNELMQAQNQQLQEQLQFIHEHVRRGEFGNPENRAAILRNFEPLNLTPNPAWTEADLHNGSHLQRFYDFLNTPTWCVEDFDIAVLDNNLLVRHGVWPQNRIDYIQQANLIELIAISTHFIKGEREHRVQPIEEEIDQMLHYTLVGEANAGICQAWLQRLRVVLQA